MENGELYSTHYANHPLLQVIPAEVDHIDFTWSAKKGSAVPYKITFMHAPSRAMANPSVNISTEGIVPTHTDKFRLFFPCTGKVAEQVETLFQVSITTTTLISSIGSNYMSTF